MNDPAQDPGDSTLSDLDEDPLTDPEEAYVEGREPSTDEEFAEDARDGRAASDQWESIPNGGGIRQIPDELPPPR